jgi:putative ATPase
MLQNPQPLAERLRPSSLDELVGQEHLKGILTRSLKAGAIPSLILWGPPGVGKTTIANIIANEAKLPFYSLSAISAGVKDIREVIQRAKMGSKSLLFIDEIHRFNKGQQDALLGAVEKGQIVLIGATTENPSFEVNSALLSRCQVYTLKPLADVDLLSLLSNALKNDPIFSKKKIKIKENGALLKLSGGDARKFLNLLEMSIESSTGPNIQITDQLVTEVAQQKAALYDKKGEMHYDIISAFIKSIRGSDPNAAVYYLARMKKRP